MVSHGWNGHTISQGKQVSGWKSLSTVLTVALWLGNNDYDSVQKCAGVVYEQLTQLKTIKHPKSGKEIKIVRRSCGDGKERRSSTGNSSAKSSYPIPEAPEHHSQLGEMKLSCFLTLGNFKTNKIHCYFPEDKMVPFQSSSIRNKYFSSNLQMKSLNWQAERALHRSHHPQKLKENDRQWMRKKLEQKKW